MRSRGRGASRSGHKSLVGGFVFTVSYNKKTSCWEQSGERRYPERAGVFKGIVTEPKNLNFTRFLLTTMSMDVLVTFLYST